MTPGHPPSVWSFVAVSVALIAGIVALIVWAHG